MWLACIHGSSRTHNCYDQDMHAVAGKEARIPGDHLVGIELVPGLARRLASISTQPSAGVRLACRFLEIRR